ncbi:Ig-like domain-containing protein, partial [Streptomyces sp. NPDC051776]|uniref:Ig-like domain-containing protein n=1 Tax=Streptomyces sp. NPDC051776 TaxID=3155414 RepID=UPI0034353661
VATTDFNTSTGNDTHTVVAADTTTTVASSPDPTDFGETVTITATVTANAPGSGTPAGTVNFSIDGGPNQPATLDGSGQASITTSALSVGTHNIVATYVATTDFNTSTGNDTHTVVAADTTTTVASSPDPTDFGELVTITATVTANAPGSGTPTGTVNFSIDGGPNQPAALNGAGQATITTNTLTVGTHNIVATYVATTDFNTSTGNDTHTVETSATTTLATSFPDPSGAGADANFIAVVTPVAPGAGVPTGTVNFVITDGVTTETPSGTLDTNGVVVVTTDTLPAGNYIVTATYAGDGNYTGSSDSDTHVVA